MNSVQEDVRRSMPTKEELIRKYIEERKSMAIVAKELGIAVGTVYNYIKRYGIESRKRHDYPTTEEERERWRKIGRSRKGFRHTEEAKAKMSCAKEQNGIGHKKKRSDGYIAIYFPDHPKSSKDGYVMEHVLIMEALIGRHLNSNECVHHINGKRDDNRAKNLKLMTKSEHMSYHMRERWKEKKGRDDLSIV